jgi:S1-C subfamily serine protease
VNGLDLVLLLAVLLFGWSGYRQGLLAGIFSFGGFVGGGLAGLYLGPTLADTFAGGNGGALVRIIVTLVAASLGQLVGTVVGGSLRRRVTWEPARLVDSTGGALLAGLGVLVVAWGLGSIVRQNSPLVGLNRQINESLVLREVDRALPPANDVFGPFLKFWDRQGFPTVISDLGRDTARVDPPDTALTRSPAVRTARSRVLKILGVARSCSRRLEGTGFVYARERVMTNAHVVAGVKDPDVVMEDGRRRTGRVVLYDPGRDVAVIYVPGLDLAPLAFAGDARRGDDAVVVGYPEDGPFTAGAARVRERITAVGRDIYQRRNVRRDVYALRAQVRPGNSGGPLLAPDGTVYGVIFAAAADDPETGYALTADEVRSDATAARNRTQAVSTQSCD